MNANLKTETGGDSVGRLVGRVHLDRETGHPWSQEDGWDQLYVFAQTDEQLDLVIEHYKRKFWDVWIRDNKGKVSAVVYRPRGATGPWADSYDEMLKRCRGMLTNASGDLLAPKPKKVLGKPPTRRRPDWRAFQKRHEDLARQI